MIKNILQMLEKSALEAPQSIALSDENGLLTYSEVVEASKAIGTKIAFLNNLKEPVAVLLDKTKMALLAFFGIVYSGNFYIPIDVEMPNTRIAKIFSTVHPFAIITDTEYIEKAETLSKECGFNLAIINCNEAVNVQINDALLKQIRDKAIDTDPVYALFTSGSTGTPKGVVCCHRSVIDYADWLIDTFSFDKNTIIGNQAPFYFSMSVLDIFATIRSGAHLHIIPKKMFSFPANLLEHLNEKKINTIYWVPTALCIVANTRVLDKIKMPFLKTILFAGETMPTKQLNIWRKNLPNVLYANLFGPTEITDIGIYYIVDRDFSDDEPLPIGRECDNVDAIILNPDSTKLAQKGEIGELCIRGSFLAMGYYNNPAKTSEAFIQNPLNSHYPEIIYRTGDLVSVNERGEMMYHGRKDFQIKHKGNRIELGEIENAAFAVPGIESCACIYDKEKERIVLFFQGENVDNRLIRDFMKQIVPSYMIPNVMLKMTDMPKNQNGKIDRKSLVEYYQNL